jgi:hypothetical protein
MLLHQRHNNDGMLWISAFIELIRQIDKANLPKALRTVA